MENRILNSMKSSVIHILYYNVYLFKVFYPKAKSRILLHGDIRKMFVSNPTMIAETTEIFMYESIRLNIVFTGQYEFVFEPFQFDYHIFIYRFLIKMYINYIHFCLSFQLIQRSAAMRMYNSQNCVSIHIL